MRSCFPFVSAKAEDEDGTGETEVVDLRRSEVRRKVRCVVSAEEAGYSSEVFVDGHDSSYRSE